jgi:hypothetical protein
LGTVGSALGKVGGILWDHRGAIGAAVVKGLDDEEVKIKVQFDATVYGPIVGSQSLSRTAGGMTTYGIDGGLGGGFFIAGGEEFRLLGQKDEPSNWTISGNFGSGGSIGLTINMMDWRPTSVLTFVGVGVGGSMKIEPPAVSTKVFEATIDNNGNVTKKWGPGP